jgi:CDP-glucose 4,6-dehydratase
MTLEDNIIQQRYWYQRPVFVTGATGLLGGWLVKELVAREAAVVALVRDASPLSLLAREGVMQRITRVYGSLADLSLIRRALCQYSIKTVFHLAAQPLVGAAKKDPIGTLEANVQGSWHILEAARQAGVETVVIASSDKAYGPSDHLPYQETHPLQARSPYDVSKSCVDLISTMYAMTYGMRVAITWCANLFGGGDLNLSRIVPDLIRATLQGENFVIRSDGKYVRDLLYVTDAVAAYLLLAERLSGTPSLGGEAFNFGLGLRVTVLELVQTVLDLMGRSDLQPIIQNTATAEIREQYMDSGKARDVLGWRPRYTLEEGLKETISWYTDFFVPEHPSEQMVEARVEQ